MQEELDRFQSIYDTIIEFFINYSFQLIGAVLILLAGLIVAGRVAKTAEGFFLKKELDVTLSRFMASCIKIAIVTGIGIIALGKLGISVTPFVAAIGALSLGAGLAMQGLLANYGAGLNIIMTRPFIVGDTIMVQGVTGVVTDVHLAFTVLTDEDDVKITIPNRHIVGEIIHNSNSFKLAETSIGVAYGSDPVKVMAVIRQVLQQQGVTENREPLIGIDSFGDSGLNFAVRFWVPTESFHQIRFSVNNGIYEAFEAANIEIPFPQTEVRLLNDGANEAGI
jgi:small conductance mechanosensitive channel